MASWAWDVARSLLAEALPRRWAHVQGVAAKAERASASTAGASLRELMDRMGHSSARAALIYLHGSDDRQRAIADGLNRLVEGELQGRIRERSNSDAEDDRARGGHESKGRPS